MSRQAFEQFMKKLDEDAALKKEVQALARDENGVKVSDLAQFAAGKGYQFTVEDVTVEEVTGELRDEQLEAVAGGVGAVSFIKLESFLKLDSFLKFS